jgi:hypothetical protein
MGVLEVVLSAVVCAVVVVSVGTIARKAGYSPWWAVVPAAVAAVGYATLVAVHRDARFGALSLHTIEHSARALAIADAACFGVMVVLLAVFAVSDWPSLAGARVGSAPAMATVASDVPARMRIRTLPDVTGQPAGWFASGALGSGEQSYWDGVQWTARRCWRNEMWIDQPLEQPLLAESVR